MMNDKQRAAIYRKVLDHCRPYRFPGSWSRLAAQCDLWEVDQFDPMLDTLTKEFGHLAVVDAGVAVEDGDDFLTLNGGTAGVPAIVCPLRKGEGAEPFDLVTDGGCLSGRLPMCAALEDSRILAATEPTGGAILAVFSPEDLAVLRLVSLPAMLATRLPTLGGRDLDEFCRAFGVRHDDGRPYAQPQETSKPSEPSEARNDQDETSGGHGAENQALPDRHDLILVGWSPARLSLDAPEELDKLVSHLRDIDRHLHLALDDIYLWRPSPEEFESIDFSVRHGRREDIQEVLVRSSEESAVQLTCPPKPKSVPEDFSAAATQLQGLLRSTTADRREEADLWTQYREKIELQLVQPLTDQAAAASDPIEKSLLVAMAGISQLAHPLAVSLAAKMAKSVHEAGLTTVGPIPETELRQLLNMSDRMVALAKECGECKRNQAKW